MKLHNQNRLLIIENYRTPMKNKIICEINTNENKAIPYDL